MKKCISILLAVILLCSCVLVGTPTVSAAKNAEEKRAIGIVFDNSGSMYKNNNQAWCRATYATEVFASMLNPGDILQIYPMNPIIIDGKEYSMQSPFEITDKSQANKIRSILTPGYGDTHIESIDYAVQGLKKTSADLKYLVVLTDGDEFYKDKSPVPESTTQKLMKEYFTEANKAKTTVMYLGIGTAGSSKKVIMPNMAETDMFKKWEAKDSGKILSYLTEICNKIFGRDTLPANRISGSTVNFDVSMKKLIVFVQGENISDLKVTDSSGKLVGSQTGSQQAKYAENGSDKYTCVSDTKLQGMMVTYEDCAAGTYTISHKGTATSVEFYYEPDADLDFVFTDANGNTVDPNALYEGDYMVSFGMKDAKTGKLIESDLLGNPHYEGNYYINGEKKAFSKDGFSGNEKISLKMGETFEADLTVTYLKDYTISKDSRDFGWPEGGITIAPRPIEGYRLEISGGQGEYNLQDLEAGAAFTAKIFYKDEQLTGAELEKVKLTWDEAVTNAKIEMTFADDHYVLKLQHKDPAAPQNTPCGECTVPITASYTPQGSEEAQTLTPLRYTIKDPTSALTMEFIVPESYIVIKDLATSQPIDVYLKLNGVAMPAEEFNATKLLVDCGGIAHEVTPNAATSSYRIQFLETEGLAEGDYTIKITAVYTDHIGRETQVDDSAMITLSNTPLWVKWAIALGLLVLLIVMIWAIMHIPAMPKKVSSSGRQCSLIIGGVTAKGSPQYPTARNGKTLEILCQKGAKKFGLKMPVAPADGSYLYMPSSDRSIKVIAKDITAVNAGNSFKITEATIGKKFAIDPQTKKFGPANPRDINSEIILSNGKTITFTGKVNENGTEKSFTAKVKIDFKNK